MKCPNCNAENSGNSKFCIKCGTELTLSADVTFCKKCGAQIKAGSKFCTKCGTPTASPEHGNVPAQTANTPVAPAAPAAPKTPVQSPQQKPAQAPVQKNAPRTPAQAPVQSTPQASGQAPVQPPQQKPAQARAQSASSNPAQAGSSAPASGNAAKAASGYASLSPSYESMKKESTPQAAPAPQKAPAKGNSLQAFFRSSKGLILIISLVVVALIVAILLVLKSFGAFPGSGKTDDKDSKTVTEEKDKDSSGDEEDEEDKIDPQTLAEIERIKGEISTYVEAGDADVALNGYYPGALDRYITLATDYDMAEEVQEDAAVVFEKYADQTRYSVSMLDKQPVLSGLYIQTKNYYAEILDYAERLEAAGIDVDYEDLQKASDELIDVYRTKYIDAINEITERENWSRDEAWNLANNAASIVDDDGNMVLFDLNDYDDPLRLRYIYCLAWATRKEVEKGVASGELTAEEALDIIDGRLEETDYNPQLIFDAIAYCNAGKIDSSPYKVAFDSIMDRVCNSDGIILVLTPEDAEDNKIDINHYWYFNDISSDADSRYQVNTTNGSTSETREWIRDNIRINRITDD